MAKNKSDYGLITHVDMDACGASIFLEHLFPIKATRRSGYVKMRSMMDALAELGCRNLLVADMGMSKEDVEYALEKFQNVIHFDHHQDSIATSKAMETEKRYITFVSEDMCSAELAFAAMLQGGVKFEKTTTMRLMKLAVLIGVYDLWKTKSQFWNEAYSLSLIFDTIGYDEFKERFFTGFEDLTEAEKVMTANKIAEAKEIVTGTPFIPLGEKEEDKVFLVSEGKAINEYTIYQDARIYYMVYIAKEGGFQMSIRMRKDGVSPEADLNRAVKETWQAGFISTDIITSAGGHKLAAGVSFARHAQIDDVIMTCESISRMIDAMCDPLKDSEEEKRVIEEHYGRPTETH